MAYQVIKLSGKEIWEDLIRLQEGLIYKPKSSIITDAIRWALDKHAQEETNE